MYKELCKGNMKTAVVIGATGLVGGYLIRRLSESAAFEQVVAVTRSPVSYESTRVLNQVVDFDDLEQHRDVFKGDVLFSCLGTTLKQAGSIEAQRVVDFDYQHQIAQLAAANGVKHYLLVSSAGADAKSKSPYLKMKGELEDAVSKMHFERISILQPSLLLGERPGFRLGETLGSWLMPALCKLPLLKKYRPIKGDEVAKKMVILGSSNEATSRNSTYRLDDIFVSTE